MMRLPTSSLPRVLVRLSVIVPASLLAFAPLAAQQGVEADRALLARETYVTPPAEVAKLVTAPRQQNSALTQQSPDKPALPGPARRRARQTTRSSAGRTTTSAVCRWTTRPTASARFTTRGLVERSRSWTPDGRRAGRPSRRRTVRASRRRRGRPTDRRLAYFANFDDASYVYVADAKTGAVAAAEQSARRCRCSRRRSTGRRTAARCTPCWFREPRMPMPEGAGGGGRVRWCGSPRARRRRRAPTRACSRARYEKALLEYYAHRPARAHRRARAVRRATSARRR